MRRRRNCPECHARLRFQIVGYIGDDGKPFGRWDHPGDPIGAVPPRPGKRHRPVKLTR